MDTQTKRNSTCIRLQYTNNGTSCVTLFTTMDSTVKPLVEEKDFLRLLQIYYYYRNYCYLHYDYQYVKQYFVVFKCNDLLNIPSIDAKHI